MDADKHPGTDLRGLIEPNNNVATFFGLLLNVVLLLMVFYKTNHRLRDYRPILLQKICIDMFYNIVNAITKVQMDYKQGYIFVMLTGPFENCGYPAVNYLTGLWTFALFVDLTGVPVQYIYRYLLVIKAHAVSGVYYLLILMFAFVAALVYMVLFVQTFWYTPEIYNVTRSLLEEDPYYFKGIPNFVVANLDGWALRSAFIYFYAVIVVSYITIVVTAVLVYQKLKKRRDRMSVLTLDVHQQIQSTLIIQAVLPFALCFIPLTTAVVMTLMKASIPGLGMVIAIVLSWMPVLNSLVSMFVIRTYRYQLSRLMSRLISCETCFPPPIVPTRPSSSYQQEELKY